MAGSRLVQSPFISVTPFSRKTSCTAESANAFGSLTRQVRHQLAVKLTSKGRPAALISATRAASYGSQASAAGVDAAVLPVDAAATSAKCNGRRTASSTAAIAVTIAVIRPRSPLNLDF